MREHNVKSFKSFRFIVLLLAAMMMLTACSENSPSESVGDLKEHFMVNGCLYWQSAFPSGTMPETFQYAGDIIETVEKTPISDWTSYSLPIGTKVYLDPQKPHQAWIDGKYRYHTIDAGNKYVMHNNDLYVYLGSVSTSADEYYDAYRNWDFIVDITKYDTEYLGNTIFEEYDSYPTQELGCNSLPEAHGVYSYAEDQNIMFVVWENEAQVYVKAKK